MDRRRRSWGPSWWYVAAAVGAVAGGAAFLLVPFDAPPGDDARTVVSVATAETAAATGGAAPTPATSTTVVVAQRAPAAAPMPQATLPPASNAPASAEGDADPTPDIRHFLNPGEVPTMAEIIQRLHQAGIHGGLGAFLPPGTSPPLVGLAVPEDYVLPEGYVRHYQATDDGQRIEAILMFSPDYTFYDAARRPIAIPEDRVVPPELAPPGLPMRRIEIPAPREPERPRR